MMASALLLRQVNVLEGPGQPPSRRDVWLDGRQLRDWSLDPSGIPLASPPARELEASGWWLAPPLVDPHSVLEDPWL
jgi:dihydroorotase